PLVGRSESPLKKASPTPPALQPSGAEARPVTTPGERSPGAKPVGPRMARASAAVVNPELTPVQSDPLPTLGHSRAAEPAASRPAAHPVAAPAKAPVVRPI